jgi:CHAT domain-containing protein
VPEDTAVLYPMIFPERLELLVYFRKKWVLVTEPVSQEELRNSIDELDVQLTKNPTNQSKNLLCEEAQKLYRWLIQPIATYIPTAQVKTLLVIPDGKLRKVPFAALQDRGGRHLIEKYALATTPNLALTQIPIPPQLTKLDKPFFLLNGLSESRARLPYVEYELEAIEKLYQNQTEKLLNDGFTKKNFLAKIKEKAYSVIHIATHGEFRSNPKNSFLWTFEKSENRDSKTADSENFEKHLFMEDLEKLAHWGIRRDTPVELLTLSACESARGSDSAALGLSGVAVKAGAKTAVASLWQVSDSSTCYLMEAFYSHLKKPISKAKALQMAKIQILTGKINQKSVCGESPSSEDYEHPYYWAAFLLIGNWL